MPTYLAPDDLDTVREAAIASFADPQARPLLFEGVLPAYVATLPYLQSPALQIDVGPDENERGRTAGRRFGPPADLAAQRGPDDPRAGTAGNLPAGPRQRRGPGLWGTGPRAHRRSGRAEGRDRLPGRHGPLRLPGARCRCRYVRRTADRPALRGRCPEEHTARCSGEPARWHRLADHPHVGGHQPSRSQRPLRGRRTRSARR